METTAFAPQTNHLARSAAQTVRGKKTVEAHGNPNAISVTPKKMNLRAPPNTDVTQHFQLSNSAAYVSGHDPDHCTTSLTEFGGGLKVGVQVKINGTSYGQNATCIGVAGAFIFARKKSFQITHYTPSKPGTYTVDYDFFLTGSGNHITTISKKLTVTGNAPKPPSGNNQNKGGSGLFSGPLLPCFLDPNRSCNTATTVTYSALGIVFVLFILRFFIP